MYQSLILFIQTAQQQQEGFVIMAILAVIILVGVIWASAHSASEKSDLMSKLASGDVTWDDFYYAQNNGYDQEARKIESFLTELNDRKAKNEANKIMQNYDLENSDRNTKLLLSVIEEKTHRCNKCYSDYMRIWNLNSTLIELRCENCKKKFTYLDESLSGVNLDNLIESIQLLYERKQLGDSNGYLRELDFDFDFEGQKSNSPNTYPLVVKPELEPMKGKTKKKSITPGEHDARSRRISQEVKDQVWNRDGGKCVECGSNENLEFDHIIPFSKGGANTYRNLQLLCESCNRSKSDSIG